MVGYKSKKKSAEDKVAGTWPKVVKGSHLTVTTYEDGKTELEWDHDALARDVKIAIEEYEVTQLKSEKKAATKKPKAVKVVEEVKPAKKAPAKKTAAKKEPAKKPAAKKTATKKVKSV